MRDHSHHIELSRDEAVTNMLAALPQDFGVAEPERVALGDALGRVLARPVFAQTDVPNALTCCLDSVAVRWDDFADLAEGALPDTSSWTRGVEWQFANTGVAMPEGFDTAIAIENVTVADDEQSITIQAAPSRRFAGTRPAGAQMSRGDVAVEAGRLVTADVAAQVAAAGHGVADVRRRPRVAFIPTGNELVVPGLPFAEGAPHAFAGHGKVYESNSAVVRGKVEQWGGVLVPFDIVPDDPAAIRSAVEQACALADIVVLNAGSSKGSDDWSVEVLEDMGTVICHQTNHGPGHHSSYSLVDGVPVVGISGPSGGASFTLNFYLLPLMRRFLGFDPSPARIPARLTAPFPAGHGGPDAHGATAKGFGESRPRAAGEFFSVRFVQLTAAADGSLEATPLAGKAGSAQTQGANAYCLVAAGPGAAQPQPGDVVLVELRDPRL